MVQPCPIPSWNSKYPSSALKKWAETLFEWVAMWKSILRLIEMATFDILCLFLQSSFIKFSSWTFLEASTAAEQTGQAVALLMGYSMFSFYKKVVVFWVYFYLFVLFGFMARCFWLSMVFPISPLVFESLSRSWVNVTRYFTLMLNSVWKSHRFSRCPYSSSHGSHGEKTE